MPSDPLSVIYYEIVPSPVLAHFVQSFWYYENKGLEERSYAILPDGCFDLLFFGPEKRLLTGIWEKRIDRTIAAGTVIRAIRFKPPAAEYLSIGPIAQLLNKNSQAPNHTLVDWIPYPKDDFKNWVHQSERQLQGLLKDKASFDPRKINTFAILFDRNGDIPVRELSERVFWSSRQMNRYFRKMFGLTVKSYSNILRFYAAFRGLKENKALFPSYYYDRSHFNKEVKKYSKGTPGELRKNENDRFLQISTRSPE